MPFDTLTLVLVAFGAGGALALVARGVVAARAVERERQRVTTILAVAHRYALGDLSRPTPDYGDDDIGGVARGMDQAVQALGRRSDGLEREIAGNRPGDR